MRLMSLMENGTVVVFGRVRNNTPGAERPDQWAFSMYNLKGGVMLGRRLLEKNTVPDGVAIVNLGGCQCLAVSHGYVSFCKQFLGCVLFVLVKHCKLQLQIRLNFTLCASTFSVRNFD